MRVVERALVARACLDARIAAEKFVLSMNDGGFVLRDASEAKRAIQVAIDAMTEAHSFPLIDTCARCKRPGTFTDNNHGGWAKMHMPAGGTGLMCPECIAEYMVKR